MVYFLPGIYVARIIIYNNATRMIGVEAETAAGQITDSRVSPWHGKP
jgi:hypothetical protein